MKCLHGKPAAYSTTSNGSFWFYGQNPTCNFFCVEDDGYMYEKAITAWRCTEQPHPRCDEHHKLAKMCVVKDLMKVNYGRPFFVCGEKAKPCSFWMWGDVQPLAKPECRHGLPCAVRMVKKEGLNKDRLFFCCANDKESTCRFFEWAPDEQLGFFQSVNVSHFSNGPSRSEVPLEGQSCNKNNYLATKFMHDFANELKL